MTINERAASMYNNWYKKAHGSSLAEVSSTTTSTAGDDSCQAQLDECNAQKDLLKTYFEGINSDRYARRGYLGLHKWLIKNSRLAAQGQPVDPKYTEFLADYPVFKNKYPVRNGEGDLSKYPFVITEDEEQPEENEEEEDKQEKGTLPWITQQKVNLENTCDGAVTRLRREAFGNIKVPEG